MQGVRAVIWLGLHRTRSYAERVRSNLTLVMLSPLMQINSYYPFIPGKSTEMLSTGEVVADTTIHPCVVFMDDGLSRSEKSRARYSTLFSATLHQINVNCSGGIVRLSDLL